MAISILSMSFEADLEISRDVVDAQGQKASDHAMFRDEDELAPSCFKSLMVGCITTSLFLGKRDFDVGKETAASR